MRKLVVTESITLDGVIDASRTSSSRSPETTRSTSRTSFTFEEMRGYWPHQTDDATGVLLLLTQRGDPRRARTSPRG
jgi:hypothetical protein